MLKLLSIALIAMLKNLLQLPCFVNKLANKEMVKCRAKTNILNETERMFLAKNKYSNILLLV